MAPLLGPRATTPGRGDYIEGVSLQSPSPTQPPLPPRQPLLQVMRGAPATTLVFAICVVVFLIAETSGGTKNTMTLIRFGAVGRTWVWAGEYWRLGTSTPAVVCRCMSRMVPGMRQL